jgi:hypothetical protein
MSAKKPAKRNRLVDAKSSRLFPNRMLCCCTGEVVPASGPVFGPVLPPHMLAAKAKASSSPSSPSSSSSSSSSSSGSSGELVITSEQAERLAARKLVALFVNCVGVQSQHDLVVAVVGGQVMMEADYQQTLQATRTPPPPKPVFVVFRLYLLFLPSFLPSVRVRSLINLLFAGSGSGVGGTSQAKSRESEAWREAER